MTATTFFLALSLLAPPPAFAPADLTQQSESHARERSKQRQQIEASRAR